MDSLRTITTCIALLCAHNAPAKSWTETQPDVLATIIRDVRVFHPDGSVTGPHDVSLANGLISDIRPHNPELPFTGVSIDGNNRTLVPGLIDAHVHLAAPISVRGELSLPSPKTHLDKMLYAGITTVVDLGTPIEHIRRLNKVVSSPKHRGPTIYGSGKPYTAPGGHPLPLAAAHLPSRVYNFVSPMLAWQVQGNNAVDYAFVDNAKTDFIKVMLDDAPGGEPMLSGDTLNRIAMNAKTTNRPLVAHVQNAQSVHRALDVNVAALAHAPYLGTLSDADISTLIANNVPIIATMTVWDTLVHVWNQNSTLTPLDISLLTNRQARHAAALITEGHQLPASLNDWVAKIGDNRAQAHHTIKRLHDAGATLLIGTDSPGLGLIPGGALHKELRSLNSLGIPAHDLLVSATWRNSRFIDKNAQFGAVRVGYQADLLLIDGDPARYLDDLLNIDAMWIDGQRVNRQMTTPAQ